MLGQVLPAEAFAFLMILMRMTPLVMLMPVLGDRSIPTRVRTSLALLLTVIIYGMHADKIPAMPAQTFEMLTLMVRELLVGSMLALTARILLSATHTAGTVIAFQTGLAAAQSFDPAQGSQSVIVASFVSLTAITLIVVTDLHHVMIEGFAHSYVKFPVGEPIPLEDFATLITRFVSDSFALGFQLASPFIVYAMIFNISLGLIARMIQGFQVFFIGMPMNLFMGFLLMSLLIGSLMQLFMDRFESHLLSFLG
ncbi:MAG: flagellar type III secretion system protein FliR [Kordiimonadaceae bacterium]|nr:flagellar type III secretion system protein FliR [Kordiimonadaceae bacterium]MBO6570080.1 flagellar type III secretion system protein FliR [Kordiimonadaceae bacterium]MBO6965823.1 flagellar type III secretion system protein FliR [Kordiimonadaceae bacterium]